MRMQAEQSQDSFPPQLVVEVTAGCNQDCIFCGRTYMDRPKKTMERWMWNKIVEEVAKESPLTELWPAFMGESMLLGRELFDRIAYAREAGCKKITLNTNGTRLHDENIAFLLEGTIDRLIISCDAHTPETHAKVRPGRHTYGLEGIYKGVIKLAREIQKRQLEKPLIEMQFSIFDENEHEVEAFKRFWLDFGLVVKVRPKVYWSGTVPGGNHRVLLTTDRQPCNWAMETACIHWNGNMVMCAIDSEGKYVAGNVEASSIKEMWNGPLAWIRELHRRRRFRELPEVCRACPDWKVKKAHVYFPDPQVQEAYERYIHLGREFTPAHYWSEEKEPIK